MIVWLASCIVTKCWPILVFTERFSHSETRLVLSFRLAPRGLLSTFYTRGRPRLCVWGSLIITTSFGGERHWFVKSNGTTLNNLWGCFAFGCLATRLVKRAAWNLPSAPSQPACNRRDRIIRRIICFYFYFSKHCLYTNIYLTENKKFKCEHFVIFVSFSTV